uniref:DUF7869 domain-containing protein n=1 Tax=Magallana gigas TaxID=29159 RepID=K1RDW3_MAGGI
MDLTGFRVGLNPEVYPSLLLDLRAAIPCTKPAFKKKEMQTGTSRIKGLSSSEKVSGSDSHSTNLTLSVLLSVIYMLRESLPDVFYLQMDNCARENKNRYLLAFMAYLVGKGVFRKIKVSFLMVGHTNEDIDQVFSKYE